MRILISMALLFVFINCKTQNKQIMNTIYDYKVKDINGNDFDFADLKGKKILIVNTASKCGFTPQFEGLEALYEKYKSDNFVIVGFPSNDFGQQDPGTNQEIQTFCQMNYGVSFPMMSKIQVTGNDMAPVYKFLTQKDLNGKKNSTVKWNFQKYIINEDGTLEDFFYSITKPESKKISKWIEDTNKK